MHAIDDGDVRRERRAGSALRCEGPFGDQIAPQPRGDRIQLQVAVDEVMLQGAQRVHPTEIGYDRRALVGQVLPAVGLLGSAAPRTR